MSRDELVWCEWSSWLQDVVTESGCLYKQERIRCCHVSDINATATQNVSTPNCFEDVDVEKRLARYPCESKKSNDSGSIAASNDGTWEFNLRWHFVIIVWIIVVFTCCIVFRVWRAFQQCVRDASPNRNRSDCLENTDRTDRPPRLSFDRSSIHTLDFRDYADILELDDVFDQGDLSSLRRPISHHEPTEDDAPPTYADVTAEEPEERPAVVNYPGFSFTESDAPPSYEETATLTPPPRYEDLSPRPI